MGHPNITDEVSKSHQQVAKGALEAAEKRFNAMVADLKESAKTEAAKAQADADKSHRELVDELAKLQERLSKLSEPAAPAPSLTAKEAIKAEIQSAPDAKAGMKAASDIYEAAFAAAAEKIAKDGGKAPSRPRLMTNTQLAIGATVAALTGGLLGGGTVTVMSRRQAAKAAKAAADKALEPSTT